jgi:hypothetical protein
MPSGATAATNKSGVSTTVSSVVVSSETAGATLANDISNSNNNGSSGSCGNLIQALSSSAGVIKVSLNNANSEPSSSSSATGGPEENKVTV